MTFLAIVIGALIGLSLGALGGGGSILTVPALVYLLGQSPHQATSASLLVVGIAAAVGAITHARAGRVRFKAGLVFGVLGVAGSYVGSRLSAAVPANVLLAGFGLLMLVAATAMIVRRRRGPRAEPGGRGGEAGPAASEHARPDRASLSRPAAPLPRGGPAAGPSVTADPGAPAHRLATLTMERRQAADPPLEPAAAAAQADDPSHAPAATSSAAAPAGSGGARRGAAARTPLRQAALITAAATAVGLVTGFFGVGGGFLVVPVLVLALGFGMRTAAGTSLVVIAIDSAAALISRAGHGMLTLNWALIGAFTAAAMIGSLAGGRLAGRIHPQRLAGAFTALIIVVAAYTLSRSLPGLL